MHLACGNIENIYTSVKNVHLYTKNDAVEHKIHMQNRNKKKEYMLWIQFLKKVVDKKKFVGNLIASIFIQLY